MLTKKNLWKLILGISAMLIVGSSLWYSSNLVQEIRQEERKNVELWAEAIRKRANLVKFTNELFNELRADEDRKVNLWADAAKIAARADASQDLEFVVRVMRDNVTVPVILADENDHITTWRNIADSIAADTTLLKKEMARMAAAYPPIPIDYVEGTQHKLYYRDSRIFTGLQIALDDIIESFISETVINSASVPVIYTDASQQTVIAFGNLDSTEIDTREELRATIASMSSDNAPIEIELGDQINYIFYRDSFVLTQLRLYPIVQFVLVFMFVLIGYLLFNSARRSEQNQVWVGMAKETAHQLGTPLSSLIAWVEMMRAKDVDPMIVTELSKDVSRLETITDRFSKIGSTPKLQEVNMAEILDSAISYLRTRSSDKVHFSIEMEDDSIIASLNIPLFEWVIENLSKNAIDAMSGNGSITFVVSEQARTVTIDVTDTGKGIPPSKYKTVFDPGFTTKKRGWGLGLSLAKRIIEIYHRGRIFVKWSEVGKGTTFRILLKK